MSKSALKGVAGGVIVTVIAMATWEGLVRPFLRGRGWIA